MSQEELLNDFESLIAQIRPTLLLKTPEVDITSHSKLQHFLRVKRQLTDKDERNKKYRDFVCSDDFMNFFKSSLQFVVTQPPDYLLCLKEPDSSNVFSLLLIIYWGLSDESRMACEHLHGSSVLPLLTDLLSLPFPKCLISNDRCCWVIRAALGIFNNILVDNPLTRGTLRGMGLMTVAEKYLNIDQVALHTQTLLLVAFLRNEQESIEVEDMRASISHLISILQSCMQASNLYSTTYGFHAHEILCGLANLASPDDVKIHMLELNLIGQLQQLLQLVHVRLPHSEARGRELCQDAAYDALNLLWILSFSRHRPVNQNAVTLDQIVPLLEPFRSEPWNADSRDIVAAIEAPKPRPAVCLRAAPPNAGLHVMISYQHSTKQKMLQVKRLLEERQLPVWMDVDHNYGSFIDHMVYAVERAAVVIAGLCQALKNSPHCRKELEYSYKLEKPVLPILLEQNYSPDGWLGLLFSTQIYIEGVPSDPKKNEEFVAALLALIEKSHGSTDVLRREPFNRDSVELYLQGGESPSPSQTEEQRPGARIFAPTISGRLVLSWTRDEVAHWMRSNGLDFAERHLAFLDGPLLGELVRLRETAPESYMQALRTECHLNLEQVLRLNHALSQLVHTHLSRKTSS